MSPESYLVCLWVSGLPRYSGNRKIEHSNDANTLNGHCNNIFYFSHTSSLINLLDEIWFIIHNGDIVADPYKKSSTF